MERKLVIKPNPEKNFENFVYCDGNSSIDWCKNWQEEYNLLRIQANLGNGSSHLLHAMANSLLANGRKVVLLDFAKTTEIDESLLDPENEIFQQEIVLIDHFDRPFYTKELQSLAHRFIQMLSEHKVRLALTCKPQFDADGSFLEEAGYPAPSIVILLQPLDLNLRKSWISSLSDPSFLKVIPEVLFTTENTNKEFLNSISPYLFRNEPLDPQSTSFKSELEKRLNLINLALRKYQLNMAELEFEKDNLLKNQQYEQAAMHRDRQQQLKTAIDELKVQIEELKPIIPFSIDTLDQLFRITNLSYEFQVMCATLKELNQKTNERINALELQWEEQKKDPKAPYNPEILKELRSWQQTAFKLSKMKT